jgi:hypothetical protein
MTSDAVVFWTVTEMESGWLLSPMWQTNNVYDRKFIQYFIVYVIFKKLVVLLASPIVYSS